MAYKFEKLASMGEGGGTSLPPTMLNSGSTVDEIVTAIENYISSGTHMFWVDGIELCEMVSFTDGMPASISFFKASTNQLVNLSVGESVSVSYKDIGGGTGGGSYVLDMSQYRDAQGTLSDETYNALVANAPNVSCLYNNIILPLITHGDGIFVFMLTQASQTEVPEVVSYAVMVLPTKAYMQQQICIPIESGGGSSGGIIDVNELPAENINESAIYRVPSGAKIYMSGGDAPTDIAEMAAQNGLTIEIYLVDTISISDMTPTTATTFTFYVEKSTGIAYVNVGSDEPMTVGMVLGAQYGATLPDNGWSTDIASESEIGVYTVATFSYYACKYGVWAELSNRDSASSSLYVLELSGDSGTLTAEQSGAILGNMPNVIVKYTTNDQVIFYPLWADSPQMFIFQYFQKSQGSDESGSYDVLTTNAIVIMKANAAWMVQKQTVSLASKERVDALEARIAALEG